jgi:uncharacterized membrane protein
MPHLQDTAETDRDDPLFTAVITPHRSLAPSGARLVVVLCCLAAVGSSIPFIVLGAWPVAGVLGIDVVALAIAFRASFRSAKSVEEVVLSPVDLLLRRVTHRGERFERRFNPLWTKLDREHDEDYGLMALALVSRGERVVIARELSPHERESFADAFGEALARVKRGL